MRIVVGILYAPNCVYIMWRNGGGLFRGVGTARILADHQRGWDYCGLLLRVPLFCRCGGWTWERGSTDCGPPRQHWPHASWESRCRSI